MRVSFQFFRRLLPAAKQVLERGALVRARARPFCATSKLKFAVVACAIECAVCYTIVRKMLVLSKGQLWHGRLHYDSFSLTIRLGLPKCYYVQLVFRLSSRF